MASRTQPLSIEDYALIGDCMTAALVGRDGSIDWLCVPRFDSPACFAALLGHPGNGRWLITPDGEIRSSRRAYRGASLVLETVFETEAGEVALIDFMPPGCDGTSLIRIVEGRRGRVPMRMELVIRFDYGSTIPWVTGLNHSAHRHHDGDHDTSGVCAIAGPNLLALRTPVKLHGRHMTTVADFTVEAGEQVPFVLQHAASHHGVPEKRDAVAALADAEAYWQRWSSQLAYDGPWREAVLRSALVLKSLSHCRTGGIVAAPTTSLPEQLGGSRNWDYRYCWLRDASITLFAMIRSGFTEEAQAWRDWLHRAVAGSPEQLQIMYGVAGERRLAEWQADWLPGYQGASPVRIGNAAAGQLQLDVYGEVVAALHVAREHGLKTPATTWGLQRALVEHLAQIWDQPDEGIWEVRGGRQHFTSSKVMAWLAVDRAIRAAEQYGLAAPLDRWREIRDRIHATVCEKGWSERRQSFTQAFGSDDLDASALFVVLTGFLPPEDPRARATVDAIRRDLMKDGFVLRYHTESGDDGLPPGEGAFLACSFWLAEALHRQGETGAARELFGRLIALRNDVGLLAEEYDVGVGRQVGNFPQAFSHVALINAALTLSQEAVPEEQRAGD